MNIAKGKLGTLQKAHVMSFFNVGGWVNRVLRRNILATASNSEQYKRDAVQKSCYQFRHFDREQSYVMNRPILDLWL